MLDLNLNVHTTPSNSTNIGYVFICLNLFIPPFIWHSVFVQINLKVYDTTVIKKNRFSQYNNIQDSFNKEKIANQFTGSIDNTQ